MKSILVVEDSPAIMELIRFLLTTFGYESREALDGFETLKIAKEHRFDLILLDIQLPGFDGLEVLKEIKKIPEIRRTPVIALTAHAMQGDEDKFLKAGCSGYIAKPIDIGRFKSILDTCTGGCQVL
ncbi:chemotaxis protein CheY [Methanosarcina sp. 2.H.T.1A.6]|uniref:response regulator n=1 Tax=unclassified Methanosarcina TaxID=2644672 RepID=UPI0006216475|nr:MULTISPECIES: response regulator [unclassified Methanosarcina]KKG16882.1 chemotaxis protein CheY [Methanosarcina sp. 2.H.T.1A.3]KKG20417.1 chemotaxis protein CheY [Methanosarcina sp. 2.H.T.1A.8]KKG21313.1 chemotaxis protein CheY [Methanosarcina sp. 2.H.T.1A.15]KKG22502.1 chemotaxis protein CheY [Methanosarcina sp. 2.H.T.1A.6]